MKIKKLPIYLLTLANTLTAIGLLTTGYSHHLDPRTFGWLALAGYAFPLMLCLTIAFLTFWLFVKKRYALISIIALLIAYQPVTLYCPLNPSTTDTATVPDGEASDSLPSPQGGGIGGGALTILTYNTHNLSTINPGEEGTNTFIPASNDPDQPNPIIKYLADSGADILCLQEFTPNSNQQKQIEKHLLPYYPYCDSVHHNTNPSHLWIYSRYPITRKQLIPYESKGNLSAAFWLNINGHEIIVVNNHLEVTGLSIEERTKFSEMMHGKQQRHTMRHTSRTILSRLLASSKLRAAQADAVAAFIRQHTTPLPSPSAEMRSGGKKTIGSASPSGTLHSHSGGGVGGGDIIICGDFNDIPQSYAYHTIAEGLTDCYRHSAFGPGYTFSHYGMRVRIDNILCSPTLTPISCHVDNNIHASDHYPVIATLYIK